MHRGLFSFVSCSRQSAHVGGNSLADGIDQPHGGTLAELLAVGGRYCSLTYEALQPIVESLFARPAGEIFRLQDAHASACGTISLSDMVVHTTLNEGKALPLTSRAFYGRSMPRCRAFTRAP